MEYLLLCLSMMVADNWISLDIKNHPELREVNSILGSHPTDAEFVTYAAVLGAVYTAGYYAMPKPYAKGAAIVCAAAHGSAIDHNARIGLEFRF